MPDSDNLAKNRHSEPLREKWGDKIMSAGWVLLPTALIEGQREIGLDPVDLALVLHLTRFWWRRDDLPYPSKQRLAKEMGMQPRSIQRRLARLEKLHLVKRHPRHDKKTGRHLSSCYSLDGLIAKGEVVADNLVAARKIRRQERA